MTKKTLHKQASKKCRRCLTEAGSNRQLRCGTCNKTFVTRVTRVTRVICSDGRGKKNKKCHKCCTMAKSNHSLQCLSCGETFLRQKSPAKLRQMSNPHLRHVVNHRTIPRYHSDTMREINALKAEVERLKKKQTANNLLRKLL